MEIGVAEDFLSLYEHMASFDFTKPIAMDVRIVESYDGSLEAQTDGTETRRALLEFERMLKNVYDENENKKQKLSSEDYNSARSAFNDNMAHNLSMYNFTPAQSSFRRNQNSTSNRPVAGEFTSYNWNMNTNCNGDVNRSMHSLDTLSKNLISILRASSHYLKIVNTSGTNYFGITAAKYRLARIKKYYFEMSRCIAMRELLPRRHNNTFIRGFLDRTRYLAIYVEKYECLLEDIESVYIDFMSWLINGPRNIERLLQNSELVCQTPKQAIHIESDEICRQRLENDRNYYSKARQEKPPDNKTLQDTQTCLFRYGSPGHEVSVNISTKILDNINRVNENRYDQNNETTSLYSANNQVNEENFPTQEISHQEFQDAPQTCISRTRSISTDSGFISPFNNCYNYRVDLCNEEYASQTEISNTINANYLNTNPVQAYKVPVEFVSLPPTVHRVR